MVMFYNCFARGCKDCREQRRYRRGFWDNLKSRMMQANIAHLTEITVNGCEGKIQNKKTTY